MEATQILEAFKANPTLIESILPTVIESEAGKTLIENKSKIVYESKIGEEVKKIHDLYDNDIFENLGVRAGTKEDGSKEKTYEFAKKLFVELKGLRGQKDSLTKDAEVIRLQGQIDLLKQEGGGKFIEEQFEKSKLAWGTEKEGYIKQINDTKTENETFQKRTSIQSAMNNIKFNPDTPESIKKMVLANVEGMMIQNSKFEDGKLVFLDADGKVSIDASTYKPKDAIQVLNGMDAIKDISLKGDKEKGGGGADPTIIGSIKTTKVEGKDDVKDLMLPEGIKTKTQFVEESEKALLASGITRRDKQWDILKNKAYNELKVAEMPAR
jgi:hypothetical protein